MSPSNPGSSLRLRQDKAVVEEGLCCPYRGDNRTVAISFEPWKMFWRPFAGVLFDITQSGLHLVTGSHFHSYHLSLFLCPFPPFCWAAVTRVMLHVPQGLSDAWRVAVGGKGWENAEFSLTHWPCSSSSAGGFPAFGGAMLCIFCPSAWCTFPPSQTPGCIVLCILANLCQIFCSVFIHPVNRKMD